MTVSDTSLTDHSSSSYNRLRGEKSPYLLQHAGNPVHWYPWGPQAFERAQADDKPVLLSIGYSTCHWCHVMARESFEDAEVAEVLNRVFVCIKVDREERPDIDDAYMAVCHTMTGGGGWPLTVFLTPERTPFFAATYLPPRSRGGRIGLMELSHRIGELWRTDRKTLLDVGHQVREALSVRPAERRKPERAVLDDAFRQLSRRFDERYGGFGPPPKFPSPHVPMFLLRYWHGTGNERALQMAEQTLTAMRQGGIFDHIGFGFHRYSTDERWHLPHFEKMLYDQAMLSMAYTEAFLAAGKPLFADTVRQVNDYVLRDLILPEGAFASAEDADSEGLEGLFYLWTEDEIRSAVGQEDAGLVGVVFGVRREGNTGSVHGIPPGLNVLHIAQPMAAAARQMGLADGQARARMDEARVRMLNARAVRPRPSRDDKILTDWNGLMIAALAKASSALDEPRYSRAARRAADFLLTALRSDNGRLLHRYREGEAAIGGYAHDYAFVTWGLLELYESTFDSAYLAAAVDIAEVMMARFGDDGGGLSLAADDAEPILVRSKDVYDGAVPSANSVALHCLARIGRITGNPRWEDRAHRLAEAFTGQVARVPGAHAHFLSGLDYLLNTRTEIVIAGRPGADDTLRLTRALAGRFLPGAVIVLNSCDPPDPLIGRIAPHVRDKGPIGGAATAYVCTGGSCRAPVTTPEELIGLLEKTPP